MNEAAAAFAGVPARDHHGRTVDDVYPAAASDVIDELLAPTPGIRRRTVTSEVLGTRTDLRITTFPLPDGGWGVTIGDVTAQQRAVRRSRLLVEVATRLASAASPEDLALVIESAMVEELGVSTAGLVVHEPPRCRFLSMNGYPPPIVAKWREFDDTIDMPVTRVLRDGGEYWYDDRATFGAEYPHLLAAAEDAGTEAVAALPVQFGGEVTGALALSWFAPGPVPEDERELCRALAALLGQVLDRAQRAARDRHVAQVLQASLLPPALSPPPWLQAAAAYRAADASTEVGGDLYDLVPLPCGGVALVVADVCGRGPEAAALTACIRHTLRALLPRGVDAAASLAAVDDALGSGNMATGLVAVLSAPDADGRVTVAATSAGHPPVWVVAADGPAAPLPTRGLPLGIRSPAPARRTTTAVLRPGDRLVAFTDGLTDTPHPRLDHDAVAALLDSTAAEPLHEVPAVLLARTTGPSHRGDDTAVIAVEVRPVSPR